MMPMSKNQSKLEPLYAPELYARHFDGQENEIAVSYTDDGHKQTFKFLGRVDDPATSFAGVVMMNSADGHAIIMYKGMDLPGRDEGAGRTGFVGDLKTIMQARQGLVNQQTSAAEKLYLDTIGNPDVKSVEIIGYSIGSMHLNYLAAKHDARGTAIADMGINYSQNILKSIFTDSVADLQSSRTMESLQQQMRRNVTVLDMSADILPKIAAAGPSQGNVRSLDQGSVWDMKAVAHIPQVYKANADKLLNPETPERQSASPSPPLLRP